MSQFNINKDRSIEQDKVFLVDRLFNIIDNGEIYPISDLQIIANLNSNWECSFTVYKETNGIPNPLWDKITDLALVKVENKGIFELKAPVMDENCTYKQCNGISICEAETSQTSMTLQINTEDDIAREEYYEEFPTVFYRDIHDITVFSGLEKFSDTTIYTDRKKKEILRQSSLLHRVFSEMPEYLENIDGTKIDDSLKNLQRIFSWDNTSVYDICQQICEELECIFLFDKFSRSFAVRDLKEHCETDGCRDIEDGICPVCQANGTTRHIKRFGEFSGVEIDTKNLAETIELTGDADSVKNYFKIEGADDVITSRISNRLIGNGYMWKLGTLQKSQMSDDLVNAIEAREQMMADNHYQEVYNDLWDQWNGLETQILEYQSGMMPSPEHAEDNAEKVFQNLFGSNGKIDYAYASNRYQTAEQIADSIMNYAKLLMSTNHTIEYTNLKSANDTWNGKTVVGSITFKIHIYLDGYYIDDDETKGYLDEYTSPAEITLKVAKGYDITYSEEGSNEGIYTTDYYNYLKRLIDTANAKSDITDEVITFEPITPFDISPDAETYQGTALKSTHYSKYCYNRLDSFCKAYEACSSVVAGVNGTIASNDTDSTREDTGTDVPSNETILSGEMRNEIGKFYFVAPLKSDLSYYRFQKGKTYTLTITTSSSYGFTSSNIVCMLGTSGNVYPGTGNGLMASDVTKKDLHTFVLTIRGDGNIYSHLCVGLESESDYDRVYLYQFRITMPTETSTSSGSSETVDILKYLKADGKIGNIQEDLLGKYQQYILLLSGRMQWLNDQIEQMKAKQDSLLEEINKIKDICDMEHCIKDYAEKHDITRNLWYELCSFKRQDTYRNENLIGEGVEEATLMQNIENLIERAEEEIDKACNITYSVSATIDNLLVMPEFEQFWGRFTLGNYIHMRIDGRIHTMRLISLTYDYSDLSHCTVEFSDVVSRKSPTDNMKEILSQVASIATTAKTVARQAEEGAEAKLSIHTIQNDAFNIANSRITTADDQSFTIDRYGITGRMIDEVSGEVSPEQIKVINNLLCFTDDNWAHTKTALGKITYLNPLSQEYETRYGLNAEVMIGNLIMSEKLYISDGNGSVYIDGNGITLDGGSIKWLTPISQSAVNGLSDGLSTLNAFKNKVNTALTGSATTEIGSNYVISPKIGGGYLYIVDGGNSITLNPHAGTVSDGTNTSSDNMLEIKSNAKTILEVDKSGNLTVEGTIRASDGYIGDKTDGWEISNKAIYHGCNSINSFKKGTYVGTDGFCNYMSTDSFTRITDGRLITNNLQADGGIIGGWTINDKSLSYDDKNGNYMALDIQNSRIISNNNTDSVILHSGSLQFSQNNNKYITFSITNWATQPTVYGVGIESEAQSKFISFGNKETENDTSYITPFLLNYGLNPDGITQPVIMFNDAYLGGDLHFSNDSYIGAYSNGGVYSTKIACKHLDIHNSGTINNASPNMEYNITFDSPFTTPPKVFCSAHVSDGSIAAASATNVTTTGFTLHFNRENDSMATATIDWVAIS